jgi:hypothetical protein
MNTYRRSVLIGILTVLLSIPFFTAGNARADDDYEENDTLETAWHPGYNWVRTWLSDINGLGVQSDEDWYRIDVDPASERIQVDCLFTNAEGNIDIELYDSGGTLLAWSYSANDNEFIDYGISSGGTYYIRVYYGNTGNTYDLLWHDFTEDAYEENDTLETAWHPGYNWARTWLSDINGLGVQSDEDWYRIDVDSASERIYVDCQFKDARGDIDIELHDSDGLLLAWSYSANDNEFIDYGISSGGTYYIRVYYGNTGNTYDLRWDDFTEDVYEENDTRGTAWHPGYNWERKSLSSIDGFGIQADDDWYRIDVDAASHGIQVYCQFTHAEGDIDIGLYDSTGTLLASSERSTDNEFIDHAISGGGTHYIKVYKGNAGNTYDLSWDDLSEDVYEENDTRETAWHPVYNWERTWLSDIGGLGIQNDDDWYRIEVDAASQRIQVDCRFTHADGDIDLELYDSTGELVPTEGGGSVTDNELIDVAISGGGIYYIRVHFGNTGNSYDLWWDDFSLTTATLISDFGSLGLYQYDGGVWSKLTPSDAQYLAVYGIKLVGDFGSGGLWEFDGTSWTKLTSSDADNNGNCMVAYGGSLVVDFGGGGIWEYDGSVWSRLTSPDPEYMAIYDNKLAADFGSAGLWEFDGSSWSKLTPSDADNTGNCMVAYGTGLVIDFGAVGLYRYDGGVWSRLTASDPQYLAVYGNKLVGDFGVDGLWEFDGSSWSKLTPSDADNSGNCMVAVDFK